MTIVRGFLITIASGLGFGVGGALVGYAIGRWVPDYYKTVLRIPTEEQIDIAQVGLGLGLTQGIGIGLIVGLAIVGAVAWYNSRKPAGS